VTGVCKWGSFAELFYTFLGKKISEVLKVGTRDIHYSYSFNACPRYQTNPCCFGGVTFWRAREGRAIFLASCTGTGGGTDISATLLQSCPNKTKIYIYIYIYIYISFGMGYRV
jgi:hypothetical protein